MSLTAFSDDPRKLLDQCSAHAIFVPLTNKSSYLNYHSNVYLVTCSVIKRLKLSLHTIHSSAVHFVGAPKLATRTQKK